MEKFGPRRCCELGWARNRLPEIIMRVCASGDPNKSSIEIRCVRSCSFVIYVSGEMNALDVSTSSMENQGGRAERRTVNIRLEIWSSHQ